MVARLGCLLQARRDSVRLAHAWGGHEKVPCLGEGACRVPFTPVRGILDPNRQCNAEDAGWFPLWRPTLPTGTYPRSKSLWRSRFASRQAWHLTLIQLVCLPD